MLSIRTKSKFRKANYLTIAKKLKNLSAAERDWTNESIDAIRDLILLANKLPNDVQKEIFQYENIMKFAQAILKGNEKGMYSYSKSKGKNKDKVVFKGENRDYDKEFDKRVAKIAACLVREGIKVCAEYYQKYRGSDPEFDEPFLNNWDNTAKQCNRMVFRIVYDSGGPVILNTNPKWDIENKEKS